MRFDDFDSIRRHPSRRALLQGVAAGGLAASLGSVLRFPPTAAAQEATPAAAAPSAHRVRVGEIDVVVLNDATAPIPAPFFAVNGPEAALAEVLAAQGLAPEDPVPTAVSPLLVETAGQRVLFDTGVGAAAGGLLLDALASEQIAPEEIDIVLLTHLHGDHLGGALDAAGAPAFPNARYLINTVEYEFWWSEPSLDELVLPEEMKQGFRQPARDVLTALRGTLEQIAPGDEFAPGLTAIDARGHTPGQLAVEIASYGETALHIADAAHLPDFHLENPDWFTAADNWPAWSAVTRQTLFDRAADENLLVAGYHFPFPGLGRVAKDEVGWIWTAEG